MTKKFLTRVTSTVIAMVMLVSAFGGISVFAEREYAAELSINGATVDFKNEPYSKFNTVFVPLEELCGYIGIDITRSGNTYTLKRMRDTLTMDVENIVININGKTVLLQNGLTEHNGVAYAPVDIFSEAFKCPVTLSEDFRSADIQPNVYSVVINQDNAAAISAALPDKDTLVVSSDGADQLFYKPEESPEKEIAVFYKADLSDFADKKIASASLNLHVARGTNLNQHIVVQRTKPWNKGELNFANQPAFYEGQQVDLAIPSELQQSAKNWGDMQFNITSLVNGAIGDGEPLAVKLLGTPFRTQKNPGTPQAHVKGVNTTTPPYIAIEVNENYTFPVKKVETASVDESRFDELQILRSLGVFTEEDEFPLDMSEPVTRGEFLTYAMRLRGNNIPVGSSEQFFSDVPTDNGYFAVTSSAYELGYIAGWQGIAFRPYDAITVGEAVTILGRMLNYDVYADERGGFTPGYFQAAAHGDLYVGVNDSTTQLSFKQMFRLLEDALDAKMLNVYSYSSNGSAQYTFDENMTILTEFWNAEKIEGTITANEYSNIVPNGAYSEGYITITTSTGATKKLRLNYEPYNSLLGFKVKGYYEKHENVLLYIGTMDSDVEEYNYSDIESFNIGASDISFSYKRNNGSLRTESFSKSANVIYNGKSVDATKLKLEHLDTGSGKITIVGNNLVIIDAYRPVVVASVNVEEETVYDLYEKYKNILYMKNKEWQITDENGKEIKLEDLKKYDVLSAAVSFEKDLYKCILTRKTVSGKIEAMENSGSDGDILTINGIEYKTINRSSGDWEKYLTLNSSGTFLLNHEGLIVGMSVTPNEEILGYVVAMDYSGGSSLRKNLQAALMVTGSEKYVVYDLASTVKIDGKKYTDHEKIKENTQLFPSGKNNPVKMQGIIFSLNNEGKINVIDTEDRPDNIDNVETTLYPAYNLKEGVGTAAGITPIEPEVFNAKTKSAKRTAGGLDYKSSTPGKIADKFFLNLSEALCVVIPTESDNVTPVTDIDKYMTITRGIPNDEVINPIVYTVGNKTPNASIVVLEGFNPGASVDDYYLVVDRVVNAYDAEGTEIQKIYYYSAPDKRESVVVPYDMEALLTGSTVIGDSIKRGDIIRIGTNVKGELSAITEYFDYDTKKFGNLNTSFTAADRLYGGITTEIYDEFVKFNLNIDVYPAATESEDFWLDTEENFNFYKYTVSSSGVEVMPATIADVRPSENAPDTPTGVLLQASYASLSKCTGFLLEMNTPPDEGPCRIRYSLGKDESGKELTDSDVDGASKLPAEVGRKMKETFTLDEYPDYLTRDDYRVKTDYPWLVNGVAYAEKAEVIVDKDLMLVTPNWESYPTVKITLKPGDGTPEEGDKNQAPPEYGTYITPDADEVKFTKAGGYKLIGWKDDQNNISYLVGENIPLTDCNMVLTAQWSDKPVWDGETVTAAADLQVATADDLDGAYTGYYMIKSGADLAGFANLVNSGTTTANAVLCNDIYLNYFATKDNFGNLVIDNKWYDTPANVTDATNNWNSYMMGTSGAPYAGTFDGKGNTIYGMFMKDVTNNQGMFAYAAVGATIKDFTLKEVYITASATSSSSKFISPLVANATTTTNKTLTMTGVTVDGGKLEVNEGDYYMPSFGSFIANYANTDATSKIYVNDCRSSILVDSSKGKSFDETGTNAGVGGFYGRGKVTVNTTDSTPIVLFEECSFTGTFNVPGTATVKGFAGRGSDKSTYKEMTSIKNCTANYKVVTGTKYTNVGSNVTVDTISTHTVTEISAN